MTTLATWESVLVVALLASFMLMLVICYIVKNSGDEDDKPGAVEEKPAKTA